MSLSFCADWTVTSAPDCLPASFAPSATFTQNGFADVLRMTEILPPCAAPPAVAGPPAEPAESPPRPHALSARVRTAIETTAGLVIFTVHLLSVVQLRWPERMCAFAAAGSCN